VAQVAMLGSCRIAPAHLLRCHGVVKDIDKVIAGCWTGCWSAMSSSEAVVDGAVKSRPADRSSKWPVLEILRIDRITKSGEA
jgi:hypothetical protein